MAKIDWGETNLSNDRERQIHILDRKHLGWFEASISWVVAVCLSTFVGIAIFWIWIVSAAIYHGVLHDDIKFQAEVFLPVALVPALMIYNAFIMIFSTFPIGVLALVARHRSSTIFSWLIFVSLIGLAALVSSYFYSRYGYDFFDQDGRPQSTELSFVRYAAALMIQCFVFIVGVWIARRFAN